eukprot:CCRYP_006771-RA/>CCRYP_006771-RA protein AED:0.36 eAED:0.36 QI:809/1/1/1/0.33/0/4/2079/230
MSDCAVEAARALSSYEENRARNIERNNARLRSLGLISVGEEKLSNDAAWGRNQRRLLCEDDGGHSSCHDEEHDSRKTKKRTKTPAVPKEGSRKSRRLMKLAVEFSSSDEHKEEDASERKEMVLKERDALVAECREARQRAALEVANAGVDVAGKENPTASYEHCLMRVRTMSEKGLKNRIRAIERAAGKHCVVKMAIFKSCLQDEGLWEIAEMAADALERLKGLLPPPSD